MLGYSPYGLNDYNFLQFHYYSPPQSISPYNQQIQQCCSTEHMRNEWQTQQTINSLQSQIQKIKDVTKDIDTTINIPTFKEEIRSNEHNNLFDKSIKNYMDKEFLYESELKKIEDEFHFNFKDLKPSNISKKDKIYIVSMQIIEKLKDLEDLELKYINNIDIIEFRISTNSIYVTCNDNHIWDIKIESNDITNKNKDAVMNMCNKIIIMNIPEYQKFYEKYKNRIVKDNEYEDLSYYEKILEENT